MSLLLASTAHSLILIRPRMLGTPMDSMNVTFPKGPKGELFPIVINSPSVPKAEPKVAEKSYQKPIIFVPLISEPIIKKRIIVHHSRPQQEYYRTMTGMYNQYYENMAKENEYYPTPGVFEGKAINIPMI